MLKLPLKRDDEKRLEDFFDKKEPDNYYVYVLFDDKDPFYVGKGIGTRCLDHSADILEARDLNKKGKMTDTELAIKEKEYTAKQKRIDDAIKRGTFDIAIVKFGLTAHEAFMVESATINTLEMLGYKLTNIVNGQASDKEKPFETKARMLNDVLKECCPPVIEIKDIKDYLDKDPSFDIKKDTIAFISYGTYYKDCTNETITWDCVRGCWRMGEEKARKAKYIFAVHNNIVKCIYKIKKDGSTKSDYQKIQSVNACLTPISHISTDVMTKTAEDNNIISYIKNLLDAKPSLIGKPKDIAKELIRSSASVILSLENSFSKLAELSGDKTKDTLEHQVEKFCCRVFFTSDLSAYASDADLLAIRENFENHMVEDLAVPQGSFKWLEDCN